MSPTTNIVSPRRATQLLPLVFWQTETEPGAQLRPAADPVGDHVVTSAAARTVHAGNRQPVVVTVGMELTVQLGERSGAPNRRFLVRTLSAVMVLERGRWVIDGWDGQWQSVKPSGQVLPAQPGDAPGFVPR